MPDEAVRGQGVRRARDEVEPEFDRLFGAYPPDVLIDGRCIALSEFGGEIGGPVHAFGRHSGIELKGMPADDGADGGALCECALQPRSDDHTSELQSLMRIPYAVLSLKKKKHKQ